MSFYPLLPNSQTIWVNTGKEGVMVNFMCWLGPGVPIYLVEHYFWACLLRVFLEELSIWIGELNKADGPPQCRWASSNPLRASIEQKRQRKIEFTLCLTAWAGTLILSFPWHSWFSGHLIQTGIYTSALHLSGLWSTPLAFLALQLANSTLGDLPASIMCEPRLYYILTYLSTYHLQIR